MTQRDLAESLKALKTTQSRLEEFLRKRDGITVERTADASDEAQYSFDRDLAIRTLDRESRLLYAVRLALQRLDEGTYGICQRCDGAVGAKRLAAVPWAGYCVHCQEILDSDPDAQWENGARLFPAA